jgi:hypothetical protein
MVSFRSLLFMALICLLSPAARGQVATTACKFFEISDQPIFAGAGNKR